MKLTVHKWSIVAGHRGRRRLQLAVSYLQPVSRRQRNACFCTVPLYYWYSLASYPLEKQLKSSLLTSWTISPTPKVISLWHDQRVNNSSPLKLEICLSVSLKVRISINNHKYVNSIWLQRPLFSKYYISRFLILLWNIDKYIVRKLSLWTYFT